MAGMFDDLVPAKSGGKVSFDDLIPAKPKRSITQDVTGAMAQFNRGLGIGDELAAAGSATVNALQGKGFNYNNELAKQRGFENDFQGAHPKSAALARGTGMAATAVVPAGESANLLAQSPRLVNAAKGAVTAGLSAAGYAAADAGTGRERLKAASDASMNPLVLGLGAAGGAMAPAASKAPKPRISQDVINLRSRGVQLTPGQARGGLAKASEDAATSLPILGTAIQNARTAGLESFSHAVGNEALAPVGLTVPKSVPAGHATVAHVERTLGKLYDEAIPKGHVVADPEMIQAIGDRIGQIAQDLTPASRKRLGEILGQRVTSRFGNGMAITGEQFQRIHSELGTSAKRFSASGDADQRAIGEALDVMREELRSAAARQHPEFAAQKTAIDAGYALFKRMQGAAASPGAEGGIFTAAQYGGAVRRGDRSLDKGASARGGALGQDFADSARAVLPNKTPDSGTATRGALVAAGAAGAKVAGAVLAGNPASAVPTLAGGAAALGALKLGARAYSPEALHAANAALDGRISRQQQAQALQQLKTLALRNPKVGELYREVAARFARTGGVIGSQNALANANSAP